MARTCSQNRQKIVEIGTVSASLTTFVASIVKPRGHVYTFDVDSKFMKIAEKNIKKIGMEKYITMKKLDLKTTKRIPLKDVDNVIIDRVFRDDLSKFKQALTHLEEQRNNGNA